MFKNVKKLSTKLILAFIVVAIISSLAGVVGAVVLKTIDEQYGTALVDYGFSQGYIGKLGMALNENRAYIRDIVFLTDEELLKETRAKIDENSALTQDLLVEVDSTTTTPAGREVLNAIQKGIDEYRVVRDEVLAFGMANNQEAAYDLWINTASPMINQVVIDAETLLDMNVTAGDNESARLTNTSNVSLAIIIASIFAGLLVSIILAILIAKSISRPVVAVKNAAAQLANGDLSIDISSDQKDEVGQMTNSFLEASQMMGACITDTIDILTLVAAGNFNVKTSVEFKGEFVKIEEAINQISDSLSATLNQIHQASDQVAMGSDQVSQGAQALSQGATEQASSIEELSATINEISAHIKNTAEHASTAKDQSEGASGEVSESNKQMQSMISAMNDISSKSSEISKIIKTIEDIAFQTNILALNAAVEAARAGAAGKGFAVVADEVRNLAGKSAEAANNTTTLIEETVSAVERGSQIADRTAQAMLGVVKGTQSVTNLIQEISNDSLQQSESVSQVTLGVDQIASVVQNNSATAEESAAASEELNSQAQLLKDLVGRFILKQDKLHF